LFGDLYTVDAGTAGVATLSMDRSVLRPDHKRHHSGHQRNGRVAKPEHAGRQGFCAPDVHQQEPSTLSLSRACLEGPAE